MTTRQRFSETQRNDTQRCGYPGCPNPPTPTTPGSGSKSKHCKDHTRLQALRERQRLNRIAEKEQQDTEAVRPISAGITAFADVVRRHEKLLLEFAEIAATISDPASLSREIAEIQRAADARIADAEADRDTAQQTAARARSERDEALADRDEALAIVDEAERIMAEAGRTKRDAAAAVHEARGEAEAAVRERDAARDAQIRAEAERDHAVADAQRACAEAAEIRQALIKMPAAYGKQIEKLRTELSAPEPPHQAGRRKPA